MNVYQLIVFKNKEIDFISLWDRLCTSTPMHHKSAFAYSILVRICFYQKKSFTQRRLIYDNDNILYFLGTIQENRWYF